MSPEGSRKADLAVSAAKASTESASLASERECDADVEALRSRGHEVEYTDSKTATTQLVVIDMDTGEVHAVSDARKGGKQIGRAHV